MQTLISILAVAVIAVAVSMSPASDVQVLSKTDLGDFVGACCKEPLPRTGEQCAGDAECIPTGMAASKKWADPNYIARDCITGLPDGCEMTATLWCGSELDPGVWDLWENSDCSGARSGTDENGIRSIPYAAGTECY